MDNLDFYKPKSVLFPASKYSPTTKPHPEKFYILHKLEMVI